MHHVDVLAVEVEQDALARQRLGAVPQDRLVRPLPGEDEDLRLVVELAVLRLRGALAALHADVPVEGEMADLAAEQAGRDRGGLLGLFSLAGLRPGRLVLGEIGDGVVAEHDEIAAGDLHRAMEVGAPLLGLGAKGLGREVERSRRDGRGHDGEGSEDHRPPRVVVGNP